MQIIPSVLYANERAYKLVSETDNWDKRGNWPLWRALSQYETYGDGTVQHSGDWCVQWSELTDACLSLTAAILADPQNKEWRQFDRMNYAASDANIEFALSVVYREDEKHPYDHQYFSTLSRQVSRAKGRQYDKRWRRVENWMDGSAAAAVGLILLDTNHDWLIRLDVADRVRHTSRSCYSWEEVFAPTKELHGDWNQAFRAFRSAVDMVVSLEGAQRLFEAAKYNSLPKAEEKEEKEVA